MFHHVIGRLMNLLINERQSNAAAANFPIGKIIET